MVNINDLINELKLAGYKKSKIKSIADKYNISQSKLLSIYKSYFFKKIFNSISIQEVSEITINDIENKIPSNNKNEFDFIKNDFKKILEKTNYIAFNNGFTVNINDINSGVMTANAGDSAEFIFVARAILAGFNCSSVDVRSSRYDAIIDYNNILLRVQIKGISTGNTVSFKDRDRGGQGIDHNHERNIGKRITSKDCDIYVAVDKQVGICYIIPMSWADSLSDDDCKSVNISKINDFKENWDTVKDLTHD